VLLAGEQGIFLTQPGGIGTEHLVAVRATADQFTPQLWLLVLGSVASLAADVAVAEPTATGRIIAAWPSFSLIAAYELLMRQVRCAAEASSSGQRSRPALSPATTAVAGTAAVSRSRERPTPQRAAAGQVQLNARRWAQDNRVGDGSPLGQGHRAVRSA
jgi:hypothetical protein